MTKVVVKKKRKINSIRNIFINHRPCSLEGHVEHQIRVQTRDQAAPHVSIRTPQLSAMQISPYVRPSPQSNAALFRQAKSRKRALAPRECQHHIEQRFQRLQCACYRKRCSCSADEPSFDDLGSSAFSKRNPATASTPVESEWCDNSWLLRRHIP